MASDTDFWGQADLRLAAEETAIAPIATPAPFIAGLGPISSPLASVGTLTPQRLQDTSFEETTFLKTTVTGVAQQDIEGSSLEKGSTAEADHLTGLAPSADSTAPSADLIALTFDASPDHVLNGKTTVTFRLQNKGLADAGSFDVDILYSNDDIIGNEDDQVIRTVTFPGLAVGEALNRTVELELPIAVLNANALAEDTAGKGSDYVSLNKDVLGIVIDSGNAIVETDETNNQNRGKGLDKDDVTYFPWDVDDSGQVTPTDAIFVINRLGESVDESNEKADFNGDGLIAPTDAIAAINRLGYRINPDVIADVPPTPDILSVTEISPANGSEMVTLTREAIVRFSKRIDPSTVTGESIKFISLGTEVTGRLVVSSTEKFATFFPTEPWNPSTEVRIVVDGDKIIGRDGTALDANKDGVPGGIAIADFTTLPITRIPDTDVFGYVYDSYNKNPDGSNIPLQGVEIRVDAIPDLVAVTDENGYFILEDVPAPEFHVYIDGSKVADVPEGSQYASLGKAFHSVPGEPTRLFMDGEDFDIYLPLMAGSDIVGLSSTEDTEVGFGNSAQTFLAEQFPDVDPDVWARTQVTFVAGSAQDDQGNVATQATIVPVDPNRLPAPLPPGLDLPLVISIQAGGNNGFNREAEGGATNFDVPAPVTFPNLDGLAPGAKTLIWSFNHDAAKWEAIGTGTVSLDGKVIESDEDTGIEAPGWHGTAPGSPTNGPEDPPCLTNGDLLETVIDAGQAAANCAKDFFAVRESIEQIFTLASEARIIVNNGEQLLKDIQDGTIGTASGIANALAGINTVKGNLARTIDLFDQQASPISKALKISKCVGQAIGFAEDLCNRLNKPDSPCGGAATTAICATLAIARTTLNNVNNVIEQANKGIGELGLTLLCGIIDEIASILGASSPSSIRSASLSSISSSSTGDEIPPEVIALLQQLVSQGEASTAELDPLVGLATSLQKLDSDSEALKGAIAQVRAEFESAPANAPYLVEYNGFELRGTTNGAGKLDLVLPANTDFTITIYDPATNSLGEVSGTSQNVGRTTRIPEFLMFPVDTSLADTDGEGLVDKAEKVIGTNLDNIDSDGDLINDFAEIQQGLDPAGGQGFPTGVIANLPLSGEAREVVVEGSITNTAGQTAYVATGSHGLAIVDTSQFNNPIVHGQINLSGNNVDVAIENDLQIAAVASGLGGIHLVDVSDSMLPTLRSTLDFAATQVDVKEGIVYATVGNTLKTFDMLTGDELQMVTLDANADDISLLRDKAYVLTRSSLDIYNNSTFEQLGSVGIEGFPASSEIGRRLFVSDLRAYVGYFTGYSVVDISNPLNPSIIGEPASTQPSVHDITTNGSGLVVPVTSFSGPDTLQLSLYNGADPTNVSNFITAIDTPGDARAAAIASGIAYVADGSGGLSVVNYRSFDTQGQAPTVFISSPADLDLNQDGIQVLEGSSIPIQVDVSDDVQVRNVELLVNGEVVSNDVSFPFDLSAIALSDEPEGTTADVQVRATDTGGNSSLSNVLTVDLVPDTFAPEVTSSSPPEGTRRRAISGITVRFNEPIDGSLLSVEGMSLVNLGSDGAAGGGDDSTLAIPGFRLSESGRTLYITPPSEETFVAGDYQLKLDPSILADRTGNSPNTPFTLSFNKRPVSESFTFGELIEDTLFEPGEDQIFTFTGTAGQRIFFDGLESTGGIIARLISPSGVSLNTLSISSDSDPISLLESGTYQWIVTSNINTTGDYSFRVFDLTAVEALVLDTDISGTLETGLSSALYQFEGTEGQQLFFDGQSTEGNSVFYLYSPGNQPMVVRNTRFDQAIILPGDGTYIVAIRGNDTESNDFSFRLSTPETTETALTLGSAVSGSISEPGEVDIYTFAGSAGQQLFFDGFNSTNSIFVQLINPSGGNINGFFNTSISSDQASINLLQNGTYQLVINSNGSVTTGDYGFRIIDLATVETLTLDTDTSGTLNPGSSAALYKFEGSQGQQLFFNGQSSNDSSSTFYLYGPGGQQIDSSSTRFDDTISLLGSGTYVVAIRDDRDEANDFSFRLSTPETIETPLTIGSVTSGNIGEPGEVNIYTFAGSAGQQLFFDGFFNGVRDNVQLIGPSGRSVDDFFSGDIDNDRGPLTLLEDGRYQLIVAGNGSETGDYGFQVTDITTVETLELDTDISGTLDPGTSTALYQFEGTKGQQIFFNGQSSSGGSTFYIYGPGNQQIAFSGIRSNQAIELTGEGRYVVAIRGFNNDATDFSLRLSTPDTTEATLTLGSAIAGNISEPGEVDIYTFAGSAGQKLFFDGFNSDSGLRFRIISPSGTPVGNSATSAINIDRRSINFIEDGIYQLIVNGNGDSSTGDYGFKLIDLATVEALTLNANVSGTLDPGSSAALYQFEGSKGQKLLFDGQSTENGSFFYLYGPGNRQLAARNTRSDRDIELPGDGTYVVAIEGFNDTPHTFSFSLLEQPFEAPEPVVGEALTLGALATGSIAIADEVDTYLFNASAGQTLYYDGLSGGSAISASLVSPSGIVLSSFNAAANRDRGPVTLIEPGEYQLRLDGSSGTTGDYSFQLLDLSEATRFALDTVVSGTLQARDTTDLFQFDGVAGQQLFFEGLGEQPGGTLYLYGPNNQLISAVSLTGNVAVTLPGNGTYYLAAESFSNTTFDYSFQAITTTLSTAPLTLSDRTTGTISKAGDIDIYTFTGTAGQQLYYDGISGSPIRTNLIGPSGVSLFGFNNVENNRGPISLVESGEYQLRLNGAGGNTGSYSFQLLDMADADTFTFDTVINGTLDTQRATDLFQFEGTAGQQLFFEGLGESFDGAFYLYGQSNQQIGSVNFTGNLDITLPGTGTYYLVAESFSETVVDYSFQLIPNTVSTMPLTLDSPVTGTITQSGELDIYTFSGSAGQRLYYDGISSSTLIYASLVSPSGVELFTFNSADGNRGPISLLESGEYQLNLDAPSGNTGDYSFQIQDLENATNLTLDTVVNGTLNGGKEVDFFQFEGVAGQQIFLEGLGEQFGGTFYLYGSDNRQMVAVGFNSNTDIVLPGTGTYYLAADGFSDTALSYSFQVLTNEISQTPLTLGNTVTGMLSKGGEVDVYTFSGTAGQRLYYDGLTAGSSLIYASLVSPSGDVLFSFHPANRDQRPISLLESGEYQLRLDGSSNTVGDYSFRLSAASAAAPLPFGSTLAGTLNPSTSTRLFSFTGTKNQNISFNDLGSRSFGGIFRLYGPGNQIVTSNSLGLSFDVTLPGNGQYLLVLEGSSNETVDYRFRAV